MLCIASLLLSLQVSGVLSASFTFTNNCAYTVWPGLLSGAGTAPLETTGFVLNQGESQTITAPQSWSGRFWGRTLCTTNSTTGQFTCGTGDCGSGTVQCSGSGAAPPATLAEFTLDGSGGMDFYDVSLVDGYNLPLLIVPQGGTGTCRATGCLADLNSACPTSLKVVQDTTEGSESVACRSACEAFDTPEYCCSGEYGSPNTCKPSSYSQYFKNACPHAYSYAYDDATSTFTCTDASYTITFCPSTTSEKSSGGENPEAVPLANNTMAYLGANQYSASHALTLVPLHRFIVTILAFSVLALSWLF